MAKVCDHDIFVCVLNILFPTYSPLCCYNNLHSSEQAALEHAVILVKRPWMQCTFHFIPKVFLGVEVRARCSHNSSLCSSERKSLRRSRHCVISTWWHQHWEEPHVGVIIRYSQIFDCIMCRFLKSKIAMKKKK